MAATGRGTHGARLRRFHALAGSGEPLAVEDYKAPCPPWALFEAAEDGFDPSDTRM